MDVEGAGLEGTLTGTAGLVVEVTGDGEWVLRPRVLLVQRRSPVGVVR